MPLQKSTRKKLQEPLSWCNPNSPGSCMVQFVSVECTHNVGLSQNHPLDLASGVNCLQRNLFDDTINDETVLGVGTSLVGHIYPDWASKVNMTCIRISISKTIRTRQKKRKRIRPGSALIKSCDTDDTPQPLQCCPQTCAQLNWFW